ncbi:glycosyltransferase family 4 protein [Candidatus Bathyarchaeota archaeon]|nr:glycosyltransferase family 4 protein [Candidatus Bathyarchaeota archaeon]
MRLLIVTSSFPRFKDDFHGRFIYDQCNFLSKNGITVEVLSPRSRSSIEYSAPFLVDSFKYFPLKKFELLSDTTMKGAPFQNILQLPTYLISAYFKICAKNVDIIHSHIAIPLGFISSLSKKRIPKVVTCHGSDCTTSLNNPLFSPFLSYTLSHADVVLTVSNHINRVATIFGGKNVKTLPLGIDTNNFKPSNLRNMLRKKIGIPDNVVTIGTLSRLVPQKRVEDFICAAALVNKVNDFLFIIGGDGPCLYSLKKLVFKFGLKNVLFLGKINDPSKFYQLLDVFVLTSVSEGLSISLQEAMASGCIPIASTGCGSEELIRENVNGYLFPPYNYEYLANLIIKAVENKRIGEKSRETIIKYFNIEKNVINQIEIYKGLLTF